MRNMRVRNGFTLIELVIVIAIIGILAALAVPRFMDLSGAARVSATRAGLGSIRSQLAIQYAASATGGAVASYPASLAQSDFAGASLPVNALNNLNVIVATTGVPLYTLTSGTNGFWFVTNAGTDYGRAGAFAGATVGTNTSDY